MVLTPECVESVLEASPFVRWWHAPESDTTILVILGVEILLHVLAAFALLWWLGRLVEGLGCGLQRLYRWGRSKSPAEEDRWIS